MDVITTSDFDGIPEGSCIQDVQLVDDTYVGLWCSAGGSYTVAVSRHICREKKEEMICKGISVAQLRAFIKGPVGYSSGGNPIPASEDIHE